MSNFQVQVRRILKVEEHPNADRLTLVTVDGYRCISNKKEDGSWRYQEGDLVVYIPEAAVVPEWLLRKMNMWNEEQGKGILAGSKGDRVKAIKLRGILSQGILYPVGDTADEFDTALTDYSGSFVELEDGDRFAVSANQNVAEALGITKYEPPIPASMSGDVENRFGETLKFDVENFQRYPHVLEQGEKVVITEKLHGTFCGIAYWPKGNDWEAEADDASDFYAFSKGLGAQGLVFKNNENNAIKNVYVRTMNRLLEQGLGERVRGFAGGYPVFILGEVFGEGIQDLHYGQKGFNFRVFDIWTGTPQGGQYASAAGLSTYCEQLGLETVPILYEGGWDVKVAESFRDGKDTLSGDHVREGIVIRTAPERKDIELGRVILKMVSPDYLLRKGGTEFT